MTNSKSGMLKCRPGLSRILKESRAVGQAKPGHMYVLRAFLKMSLPLLVQYFIISSSI